jgi:hypothetical protein
MLKQIFKYIFIFLAFVTVITMIFSGSNAGGTAFPESSSTSSHQFCRPADGGQTTLPDNSESLQTILAGTASKLGITTDKMAEAYSTAQSNVIPFSGRTDISQDMEARTPKDIPDNASTDLATMFKIMAIHLGIPAQDISDAWQLTVKELSQSDSNDSGTNTN